MKVPVKYIILHPEMGVAPIVATGYDEANELIWSTLRKNRDEKFTVTVIFADETLLTLVGDATAWREQAADFALEPYIRTMGKTIVGASEMTTPSGKGILGDDREFQAVLSKKSKLWKHVLENCNVGK